MAILPKIILFEEESLEFVKSRLGEGKRNGELKVLLEGDNIQFNQRIENEIYKDYPNCSIEGTVNWLEVTF